MSWFRILADTIDLFNRRKAKARVVVGLGRLGIEDDTPRRTDLRNSPRPSPGLFAKKGETIVCENFHLIGRFNRDVDWGDRIGNTSAIDFIGMTPEPELGAPMSQCLCRECGALWVMGGNFHFWAGWR